MKVVINSIQNKRVRADGLFYLYLSKLIYLNQNKTKLTKSKLVDDAGYFIEKNKTNFSNIRLNNFYFDLAKSHFYRGEYKKAFSILNEMYQNYYSKDYTTDFNLHARFLFCFICFELGEKELLKSTALSIADFMKRNRIVFKFEKKMIRFIRYDLTDFQNKSFEVRQKKLKSLKSEITTIFESKYERKVLNYFDYFYWIDSLSTRFNK